MLSVQNLSVSFAGKTVFDDVNFECRPKRRYAIIGRNGAGKSTLLKVLSGELAPNSGGVHYPEKYKLAILKQDHFVYESWRIIDVVIAGKPALWEALSKKQPLIEKDTITEAEGLYLSELEETIMRYDGYSAESVAHRLLSGLGIDQSKHFSPLSTLSGGFKLRVLLAQTLFHEPDLLLLDEPTNHLDITSIHWLEEYLKDEFMGILLFVSHDKHFINSAATDILDIDYSTVKKYVGNYDDFVTLKQALADQKIKERKNQDSKVSQLQDFVNKFGAKASKATQARSKQKQIDKMELTEVLVSDRRSPYFVFDIVRESGKMVLGINHINKTFNADNENIQTVLQNIVFECHRGERIAIIGANGLGKSTLLKIITGNLEADSGNFDWGYESQVGYFAQDHHEALKDTEQTALAWLEDHAPARNRTRVRSVLGQMLLSGDDAQKQISSLSGGEAGRLLFAHIMLQEPNVLILDEPTNHLDLEALDGLVNALKKYRGTLLFVSHDRDFVRNLATRIIVLTKDGLKDITASYDEYLNASGQDFLTREKQKGPKQKEGRRDKKTGNETQENTKKTRPNMDESRLQAEIADLEKSLDMLLQTMAVPDFYQENTAEKIKTLMLEKNRLEKEIEESIKVWESLY
jgi:ATPase subunit of ABC transporter with duplicated ATPase domains